MAGEDAGVARLAATVERLRRELRDTRTAADGRALLELAKGVLVERLRCGPAQAARQIELLAGQLDSTPLEVAAQLVDRVAGDTLSVLPKQSTVDDPAEVVRSRTAESAVLAAEDSRRAAESVLAYALTPLGATTVVIWAAGGDGSLTLAGFAGLAPEEAKRWRYVPPGVDTPAQRALARREAVWIEDLARDGLPTAGQRCSPEGGRAAIPARLGGRVLGVVEVGWPKPVAAPAPQVRRQLESLAELCAHTLEHAPATEVSWAADLADLADGLPDPALVLRPYLQDGQLRDFRIHHVNADFADPRGRPREAVDGALLLEAYPLAAGELFDRIEHVYATGESLRARRMRWRNLAGVTVVADVGISRHGDAVLLVWRVEDEPARLAELLRHAQRLGGVGGFEERIGTGEITWSQETFAVCGLDATDEPIPLVRLPEYAHRDDAVAIERFLRTVFERRHPGSVAFRLLRPDGLTRHVKVVAEPVPDAAGRLLSVRGAYQDISAQHWTEVALSATRDQLTHTEQHAEEQNRLTLRLQRAIMPDAQPPITATGLRIATRYRPAEEEQLVGGDWYDVVVLPSKQVLLSVGDIVGHGIQAATGMVVLRNALRGLAITGAGPARLLTWLNLVAYHLTDEIRGTAACALYDPSTGVLRWARAGHPPPVLVRDGQATSLPLLPGVLLGAFAQTCQEEGEVRLCPGDRLLLYTDGLIERRDQPLEDSIEHLLSVAAGMSGPLEEWTDHVLEHSDANTVDDTCVVAVQVG
ncbi:SpoIIE family protein phosphatase [Amycolatopsis sp. K13G38]|uniref:SpoIIE family protein phosphatase n=1 Tax=Amycolatopsis acididurans TaxID=2724524 RepID=A0ABX1J3W8_9PSEU|nr:SpoIIE family protein phosphatase [Amycolatopsis acididurans]NKQ54482.1 SpoIIE family protein phosphatase [Amycolatopsis acididurans]